LNASANANANAPTAESAVSVERGVRSTASAGVPLSDVGCRMSDVGVPGSVVQDRGAR
jgi:hypothetical protein